MKILINIILVAMIIGLAYLLYDSINEPIEFKAERDRREAAVIDKLQTIRECQDMFREIRGNFADNFDTLSKVLKNEYFVLVSVIGDPDDPNFDIANVQYDTTFARAYDTIRSRGISLDSLRYVPYGEGATFRIDADTINYQKTLTQVVEVGIKRAEFMGPYASTRFSKYDASYDPQSIIKFGDMNSPSTSGNWE